MKKSIIFITLLSIAFCASAQKEDNFQFGGFANVNRCGAIIPYSNIFSGDEFFTNNLPTIGYQFGFLTQYAFSDVSKIQFGIGLMQTGSTTGKTPADKNPSGAVSFESQSIHQDLMLPILYKRSFGKKSPFYFIGGLTPLLKINRNNSSIINFADGTQQVTTVNSSFGGTSGVNVNPSLGIGYEIKIFKDNYLYLQPNFDINAFQLRDLFGNKRYYTIGLTVGMLSK